MTLSELNLLESRGLISLARSQPELEYLFRHTLVQEAAYDSLLKADRQALHRAVGDALEQTYPQRLEELAPILAKHFHEAGDGTRTLRYNTWAGDAARRMNANAEALLHYTAALVTLRSLKTVPTNFQDPRRSEDQSEQPDLLTYLFLQRGRRLELLGEYRQAEANYLDMEQLAVEWGNKALELRSLIANLNLYSIPSPVYDPQKSAALAERARDLAREQGDLEAEARILWSQLLVNFFQGHKQASRRYGEQALQIARQLDSKILLASVLGDMGHFVYGLQGNANKALAASEEALAIWQELDNQAMVANVLTAIGFIRIFMGEFELALQNTQDAYRISQATGDFWGISYSSSMMGMVLLMVGEVDRAQARLREAIRLSDFGFIASKPISSCTLAMLYGSMGRPQEGLEILREALPLVEKVAPFWTSQALGIAVHVNLLAGNLEKAEEILLQSRSNPASMLMISVPLDLSEFELSLAHGEYAQVGAKIVETLATPLWKTLGWFKADLLTCLGTARIGLNQLELARQALSEAVEVARQQKARHAWLKALASLAELETQLGDRAASLAHRQEALEVRDFIAENAGSPELRASFLNIPYVRSLRESG